MADVGGSTWLAPDVSPGEFARLVQILKQAIAAPD
jgi:hypothetical protein